MWTRRELKNYAKDFLRKHYLKAFIVCLIATLLSGGGGSYTSNNSNDNYYDNNQGIVVEMDENESIEYASIGNKFIDRRVRSPLNIIAGGSIFLMVALLLILLVTVGFVIEVGESRFFLDGFKGDVRIKNMFSAFNMKEYFPIVKTQFLRGLYNFLWTLLFIIPGIIKLYEYKMVPYILAEKPDLTANEVISKSIEMTSGHKMDMFILDLSFIGWYLLGALLLGLGVLFVNPYVKATEARLYNVISGNVAREEMAEDEYKPIIV